MHDIFRQEVEAKLKDAIEETVKVYSCIVNTELLCAYYSRSRAKSKKIAKLPGIRNCPAFSLLFPTYYYYEIA